MVKRPKRRPARAVRAIEQDAQLIREAIAMVAAGATPRVVVSGIGHTEEQLDAHSRLALEAGVRIVRLHRRDRPGADVAIVPIRE